MKKQVTNYDFFRAIESRVEQGLSFAESGIARLPVDLIRKLGLEMKDYPLEGKYGSPELLAIHPMLKDYFLAMKSLMDPRNYTPERARALSKMLEARALHDFVQSDVFGSQQGVRDSFNDRDVFVPTERPQLIASRKDPLAEVMHNCPEEELTIPIIMKKVLALSKKGNGLVAYALSIDEANPNNPVATTMAAEQNVLYRMKSTTRGIDPEFDWAVNDAVFESGNTLIERYNSLFRQFSQLIGRGIRLEKFTKGDAGSVYRTLKSARSPVRCVNLHTIELPGMPKRFYHWAVDSDNDSEPGANLDAYDFTADKIVTTEEIKTRTSHLPKQGVRDLEIREKETPVFDLKSGKLLRIEQE